MSKKALIAMSGGVDSSVSAYIIKKQKFDCFGVTIKQFNNRDINIDEKKTCCSLDDILDARNIAHSIKIPHYVINFINDFKKQVIDRFVRGYQIGETPNPCIYCNRYIRFEKLLSYAKQLDINYIVTGHYARIEYNKKSNRYLLKKAIDETKDQSYVLYCATQDQLAHFLFPLGYFYKSEVREIARNQGFLNAEKHDSQDICFVQKNNYSKFIEQYTKKNYENGNFVDTNNNLIGIHKGLIKYTIGQRKGLGLSLKKPMYVLSKNINNNTVTLCEEKKLFAKTLLATDFNWIAHDKIDNSIRIKAKIRYKQSEQWATAEQISKKIVRITFDSPQRAITKGQAVVLYDGDIVVGGGTIL
ncbi:MAG: tRNA 2-thiouridine(34) synthase MnmA [Clostridiales bacterium]|nr:tRNA 2-thiouridine(34) synthase MnmA [Clostridiales bacterium]